MTGILATVDDEMNMPRGTDEGFLRKLLAPSGANAKIRAEDSKVLRKPDMKKLRNNKAARNWFNVVHYAGEVSYDAVGFLHKNKDVLQEDIQTLGQGSKHKFMKDLFAQLANAMPKRGSTNPNKKSLGTKFKEQLRVLMITLNGTEPHFVRCVKPNSEKQGGLFQADMVMDQLKYAGLLEVCRIRQNGYPVRKDFKQFLLHFKPIAPKSKSHTDLIKAMEKKKLLTKGEYQVGNTQVFLRVQQSNKLEEEREKSLGKVVVAIQRVGRGFIARRRFKKWKTVLVDIGKAMKTKDLAKLEAALLGTGGLPRNGRHLPSVLQAYKMVDKLKAENVAVSQAKAAIEARTLNALEPAIKACKNLGVAAGNKTVKTAMALVKTIKAENTAKTALKEACKKEDVAALDKALAAAKKLKLGADCNEVKEATAAKARIVELEKTVKSLEAAIKKKDVGGVTALLTTMVGLGAREHPLVAQGEALTKAEAKASKEKEKEMAEVEALLQEAVEKSDLEQLLQLEVRVIQLGLDSPTVKAAADLRAKLETQVGGVEALTAATKTVTTKAKSYDGVATEDIKSLTKAIAKASKILGAKDEAIVDAKALADRMKKQVKVQAKLEDALKSKAIKQLKTALAEAQELGLETGSALAVAAEVREVDAASQEANAANSEKTREANLNKLKDATELDGTNETMDRLRKLASNKHAKLIQEASDNTRYDMGLYYKIRTDEDFTSFDAPELKAQRASHKLWSVNKPIPKSLLELDAQRSRIAVRINKALLQYCGDKSSMFPDAQAQFVLMRGLEDPDITNEIYLQICKHLRGNTKYESANRAWLLLCMCVKAFPPSADFAPYLINYLINRKEAPGLFGNYARFAIVQLDATLTVGPTVFKPQIEEIECYKKRPPILAAIRLVNGTFKDFPVTPDLRVSTVLNMVIDASKVPDDEGPVWGIFIKDSARKEELDARARLIRFYEHYNPSKLVNVDSILEIWQDNTNTLFQKLISKYGPEPEAGDNDGAGEDGADDAGAGGEDGGKKKKKRSAGIALPVSAAKYAAKMLGIQANYGAPPPPPESAWPLPWWVYLGDVYNRMIRQDREPIFAFKRMIFTEKTRDDENLFMQLEDDVIEGDLVLKSEDDLITCSAITLALQNRGKVPKAKAILAKELLDTVIPEDVIDNKPDEEWAALIAAKTVGGGDKKLHDEYIKVCKQSAVYGMCFFNAIRQDALSKGVTTVEDQYAVGVDRKGVHILGPGRQFVIRTIPLAQINKFGATSEYMWMNVDDDGTATAKKKKKKEKGFKLMKSNKNGINVLLYTIQSWEMYNLIYSLQHM